jgi:hypothetical protein
LNIVISLVWDDVRPAEGTAQAVWPEIKWLIHLLSC